MRRVDDRGSATVEAAIAVPAFALFVGLIVFGGRTTLAHQAVESAASDAARSASLARTPEVAEADARQAATSSLSNQDLDCSDVRIVVDTHAFGARVGESGVVSVTVECLLDLSDVSLPGVPGSRSIRAEMTSPVDTWRERS